MAGKVWKISICMMLTVLLCACTGNDMMEKKVRDLDFTVVSTEDISEELKSHIDERKEETFTLIYRDGENMYLIVGYGSQEELEEAGATWIAETVEDIYNILST